MSEETIESWCEDCGYRWNGYPKMCKKCCSYMIAWGAKTMSCIIEIGGQDVFMNAKKAEQLRTENAGMAADIQLLHKDLAALADEYAELKSKLKRAAGTLREWNDELAFELADELEKP